MADRSQWKWDAFFIVVFVGIIAMIVLVAVFDWG